MDAPDAEDAMIRADVAPMHSAMAEYAKINAMSDYAIGSLGWVWWEWELG